MLWLQVGATTSRTTGTHKRGVCQDDLRLVGEDAELDDVAVAVPVDHLGVCGGKRSASVMKTLEEIKTSDGSLRCTQGCKGGVLQRPLFA